MFMLFYFVCRAVCMVSVDLLQSKCGRQAEMVRSLLNTPSVVSIGVIWQSETPPITLVRRFIQRIGTSLRLYDVSFSLL